MSKYDTQALFVELAEMQRTRRMTPGYEFVTRQGKRGEDIYVAKCPNGHHESAEGYEHALFLLVDSLRVRIEDTEALHLRIQSWHGWSIQACRAYAVQLGRQLIEAHPNDSVEKHDDRVMRAVEAVEADLAKEKARQEKARLDHIAKGGLKR